MQNNRQTFKNNSKKKREKNNYRKHPTQADVERENAPVLQDPAKKHRSGLKSICKRRKLSQTFVGNTNGKVAYLRDVLC
jgi:hypothetical protein